MALFLQAVQCMNRRGLGTAVFFVFIVTRVRAGGFERPGMGARAESMGGAFVGLADDWTAIYWNPAGLASLKGTGIGTSIDVVRVRSHDSSGLANPTLPLT